MIDQSNFRNLSDQTEKSNYNFTKNGGELQDKQFVEYMN